jgi:membrane protein DedA with SNARE-associated domain
LFGGADLSALANDVANFITWLLQTLSYPGIFLAMLIEGSGIPLPSEITMPFAGFHTIGKHPLFVIYLVIIVGTAGEVAGAMVGYAVGYFGGRPLVERYGRWVMVSSHDVDRGEAWFQRFGPVVVFIARLLPAVRSYVSIAAGIARMPFLPFVLWSVLGSAIWCTMLGILGRVLGEHWRNISSSTRPFEIPIVVGVVVLLAVYLGYRHFWSGRKTEAQQ